MHLLHAHTETTYVEVGGWPLLPVWWQPACLEVPCLVLMMLPYTICWNSPASDTMQDLQNCAPLYGWLCNILCYWPSHVKQQIIPPYPQEHTCDQKGASPFFYSLQLLLKLLNTAIRVLWVQQALGCVKPNHKRVPASSEGSSDTVEGRKKIENSIVVKGNRDSYDMFN